MRDIASSSALLRRPSLERLLLVAVVVLLVLVHAATIYSVDWLPLGDYGGHLELMDVVARHGDPDTVYAETYRLAEPPRPNTLSLLVASLFGGRVSTLALGHALVALYAVGLPLSLLGVARAFGRSPWAVLLAAPLTFGAVLNVGFLNFLLGLPLVFASVALARAHVGESRRVWSGPLLALTLCVLFFAHAIAFLMGASMAVAVMLLHTRSLRGLARLWPALVPAPLMAHWAVQMFVARQATEAGRTFGTEQGLGLVFDPLHVRLQQIHAWGMQFFRSRADVAAFALLCVVWLAWLAVGWLGRRRAARTSDVPRPSGLLERLRRHDLELLTACCFAAFLVLPSHMNEMEIIHHRALIVTLLFASVWPRVRPGTARGLGALAIAPAMLLAVGYPMVVSTHFHRFVEVDVGALPRMIAPLPARSRLLYVMLERHNRVTFMGPLWHLPKGLHTTLNGGVTDNSFAVRPYTPVQYAEGKTPVMISTLGANVPRSPQLLDWDYVLVLSTPAPVTFLASDALRLVEHSGHWWLFEVRHVDASGLHLRAAGDAGGSPTSRQCPQGHSLVGLDLGLAEDHVAALTAVCSARLGEHGERVVRSKRVGQGGLAMQTLSCARDATLVGLRGTIEAGVRSLGLICAPREATPAEEVGTPRGRSFELLCPPHSQVERLDLRAGSLLDGVGIACREH